MNKDAKVGKRWLPFEVRGVAQLVGMLSLRGGVIVHTSGKADPDTTAWSRISRINKSVLYSRVSVSCVTLWTGRNRPGPC